MVIERKIDFSIEDSSNQWGVSKQEALEILEYIQGKKINKELTPAKEYTVIFVIDEYLELLNELTKTKKRSVETYKTYYNFLKRINKYLEENDPNLKITDFNEIILNDAIWYTALKTEDFSVYILNKYNSIIKSVMSFAYESNFTDKNLGYKFKSGKIELLPKYIKDAHLKKVFTITKNLRKPSRCRAMLFFLLGTGCRLGEISNIRVKDFDIKNSTIFIRKGKGSKERYIPMFKELKKEILEYLNISGMPNWDSNCNGYLFSREENTIRSKKFSPRTIQHLIERIRKKDPELEYITVHTFRHTFAVNCLKDDVSLPVLSLILGHKDPKTTMVYLQLYNEDLKHLVTEKFPFPFVKLLNDVIIDEEKNQ